MFVVLALLDVTLDVQLGLAFVYAVWGTVSHVRERREERARLVPEGLEPAPPNRRLRWWYVGSVFGMGAANVSCACFAAAAIVELARG